VDEDCKEERGWEALKLYFEFFKHFTTLSSALAVLVIALQRVLNFGSGATLTILVLLGINLLLSLVGMYVVMLRAKNWTDTPDPKGPRGLPFALMVLTIIAFVVGLFVGLILSAPGDPPTCLLPGVPLFGC
jgi:amino acid transporter